MSTQEGQRSPSKTPGLAPFISLQGLSFLCVAVPGTKGWGQVHLDGALASHCERLSSAQALKHGAVPSAPNGHTVLPSPTSFHGANLGGRMGKYLEMVSVLSCPPPAMAGPCAPALSLHLEKERSLPLGSRPISHLHIGPALLHLASAYILS